MRRAGVTVLLLLALVAVSAAGAATRPKAPPVAGTTVTGGTASLAQLRGKPVLINVWSSW